MPYTFQSRSVGVAGNLLECRIVQIITDSDCCVLTPFARPWYKVLVELIRLTTLNILSLICLESWCSMLRDVTSTYLALAGWQVVCRTWQWAIQRPAAHQTERQPQHSWLASPQQTQPGVQSLGWENVSFRKLLFNFVEDFSCLV